MRRTTYAGIILAIVVAVFSGFAYAQQGSTSGQGGWYGCPMMGGGLRGPGGWYCPWMGGHGGHRHGTSGQTTYNQDGMPLTKDQAEQLARDSIQGNPNLKVGAFTDDGDFYSATIVTKKEGALVQKIQIDKKTGWFRDVS